MGGGRTHILDGDRKDSYLESHFFCRCGQIAIATTCILFGQRVPKSDFPGRKFVRPRRSDGGIYMTLHVETGHPGIDRLDFGSKT